MVSLATVVEWDALLQTVGAAFAAGLGITFAFSLAIYGATRTAELRRDERPLAAGAAATLMVGALAVAIAGVVFGLIVMTSK